MSLLWIGFNFKNLINGLQSNHGKMKIREENKNIIKADNGKAKVNDTIGIWKGKRRGIMIMFLSYKEIS